MTDETVDEPSTVNIRMVGGMADVTIGRNDDGNVVITDYGVQALVTDLAEGYGGVTTYRLSDYTAMQADAKVLAKVIYSCVPLMIMGLID